MGYVIQICEEEIDDLATDMEVMLHAGGRIMSSIERLRYGNDRGYYNKRRTYVKDNEDVEEDKAIVQKRERYM